MGTPTEVETRVAKRDQYLNDAAQKVKDALLLAWTSPRNKHIVGLTETERLRQIDTLLHDAIQDLGSTKNQINMLSRLNPDA